MLFFTKMQATGNDFIIIDCINNHFLYDIKILSRYLCNRHLGIGADGVIFLYKSEIADFKMRIINANGTEAEMCGNGIRCLGKYIYENYLKKLSNEIKIETLAGIKDVQILPEENKVMVDMGEPILDYNKIPVFYENDKSINIKIDDEIYEFYPISIGNPHVVCFKENINDLNLERIGKLVENYKYFPNKTNVEFAKIIDKRNVNLRVWERGVGETLSCGTGACAVAVISFIKKSTENELNVNIKGGNLRIIYNKKIYLIGEAEKIFDGNLKI